MKTTVGTRSWSLVAGLLLCGSPDAAEWTPLSPQPSSESGITWYCEALQTWCASVDAVDGNFVVSVKRGTSAEPGKIPVDADEYDMEDVRLWRQIYEVSPDRILVGVILTESVSYSGGGGSANWLTLYSVASQDNFEAHEVLRLPLASNITIRACFNEADAEKRLEACHDEYDFTASLEPAKTGTEPDQMPDFEYRTMATTYPGPVSRDQDSTIAPPLTAADLFEVTNATCTYQRVYQFDAKSGMYNPNAPEPDCDDFTSP